MKTQDALSFASRSYLSPTEERNYSILSLIRNLCARRGVRLGRESGSFELEISQQIRRAQNHVNGDASIAPEAIFGSGRFGRGMVTGVPSSGGFLVGNTPLAIIDYVQEQSAVSQLGAITLGGIDGQNITGSSFTFPDVRNIGSAAWVAEGEENADPLTVQFGQNTISWHAITATVPMTREFLAQSGMGAELWGRRLIGSAFAATVDRGALAGTGAKQPIGLLYKEGVTVVSLGTDGGALTLAKLADIEDAVIASRVPMRHAGYILSRATRKKAKGIAKAAGTSTFLLETVDGEDRCNGYHSFTSNYLPDTLAKGSGSNLGSLVFGDFRNLVVIWLGPVDLIVDPFTRAAEGIVEVTLFAAVDVIATKADAFARCEDVVNT